MSNLVLLDITESIAIITLNRAERHNSLIPDLLIDLSRILEMVDANQHIRSAVLRANGQSFSTGGDISGFAAHMNSIEDYAYKLVDLLNQVILQLFHLRIPVITTVQGIVTGGSIGLILASDVNLLTSDASFTPYYSTVGFSPDGGWTAILPEIIGSKRTNEILIRNLTITAEQAIAWGIGSQILPHTDLEDEAMQIANQITIQHAGSISQSKQLLFSRFDNLSELLDKERDRFVEQIAKPDTQQRMLAFLERLKTKSSQI